MSILNCFISDAVTEAAELRAASMAAVGRVCDLTADLYSAVGLPLIAKGSKGASPKGAAAMLALVSSGDKPKGKPANGIAKDWAEVVQSLHALVLLLASHGACDAPKALPVWACPVALARNKAEASAKRKVAKEAKGSAVVVDVESDGAGDEVSASAPLLAMPAGLSLADAVSVIVAQAGELSPEQIIAIMNAIGVDAGMAVEAEEALVA